MIEKVVNDCPLCDGGPMNLIEYNNLVYCARLNRKVSVIWLSYECTTCGDFFSTTDSDTISMRRYDIRVRIEFRKLKINKIKWKYL